VTIALVFDAGLAGLILAIGAWTAFARDTFAAVVGYVIYGLLLTIIWVRLSAVDVALTEAAIGGGMTGILLLGAAARLRPPGIHIAKANHMAKASPGGRFLTAILCAMISAWLAIAILFPPETLPTLAPMVMENLAKSGLGNPVAGVLFVYRAFDTLLEKVVLLLALLGVWSLAPDRAWGGIPGLRVYAHPGSTLTFLAQLLPPIGIVVGIYMCWIGAKAPGGAFQGGTVLAAMWLLVMIAGLRNVPSINQLWLRLLLVVGPAIFLIIGIAGFALANAFLAYPSGYAKPLIVAVEAALTLSIAAALGLLAAGAPERSQRP
jgi:multisubunit Na+/H+ antiporter MnhB subunit